MKKKIYKVIIDTDPGVDDTNALVYMLNDPQFDIKLFTIANGNVPIEHATRNMCYLLDIFNKDIPVVQGYTERLGNNIEDAVFLHGEQGMGGFIPPKTTKHKPLNVDVSDAMYDMLKKHPGELTLIILGPHTNFANLMQKHPESKNLIKNIVMMGGAPHGIKANPNHNSFNIRTDAPAFDYTVKSGIETVMCPSSIGRDAGYFTKEQVEEIKNTNTVGKFLAKTYETYWEPNYEPPRIATNDISAVYYITHPNLYKTKRADVEVDLVNSIGKTIVNYNKKGKFKIVLGLKRKKFQNMLFKKLKEMDDIKIIDKTFLKNLK